MHTLKHCRVDFEMEGLRTVVQDMAVELMDKIRSSVQDLATLSFSSCFSDSNGRV